MSDIDQLKKMVFFYIHYAIEENEIFNLIIHLEQLFSEEQLEESIKALMQPFLEKSLIDYNITN